MSSSSPPADPSSSGTTPMDVSPPPNQQQQTRTPDTTATASGSAATASTTTAAAPSSAETPGAAEDPTDEAVLAYLKKKGLSNAALELSRRLEEDGKRQSKDTQPLKEQLEEEDNAIRAQRTLLSKSTGGGYGYDKDAAAPIAQWGVPNRATPKSPMGEDEARDYLDAFTSLQLWVLSLPDDPSDRTGGMQSSHSNPIQRAQQLIDEYQKNATNDDDTTEKPTLQTLIQTMITPASNKTKPTSDSHTYFFNLPPSAKHELLAVTFALLVHTYCELLEVGMESTAHVLRDTFQPIYEPLYRQEYRDLFQCKTTEDMMRLNSHNSQHLDASTNLKSILVQIASFQLKREELTQSATAPATVATKLREYDRTISLLQQKYAELSQRASMAFDKMHDLPFLRRARAVRWQLTLSTTTYGLLASFLSSSQLPSLLAMSTLLQTKCELQVEQREPLPFTPSCCLLEDDRKDKDSSSTQKLDFVSWATPVLRRDTSPDETLPFPKYHLDEEYDDAETAEKDKKLVEFNRAVLVHGFRRLEALERSMEYESLPALKKKRKRDAPFRLANPLEPSVLLSTLCSNSSAPLTVPTGRSARTAVTHASSIWNETGIGMCCAKICPPDGRRVAVGCDDAAVRIWSLEDNKDSGSNVAPSQVLLGHKNGFPVFDVDWNRDGRSLLSAGGDGSIRLWDTLAVGPFGGNKRPTPPAPRRNSLGSNSAAANQPHDAATAAALAAAENLDDMNVPGLRPDSSARRNGAALAVYRGHTPSTPIWSVSFAPCGYYFASAGSDSTARLWTTDRPTPVRLFTGHTSSSVNSVQWHPNCNYILTGGEDRTVRLWDIQTGRCIRLLNGCGGGINAVKVSPCGRYASGADYTGIVHLWDLGTGKKVTEFRPLENMSPTPSSSASNTMIHSLAYSACGTALATGGDDCRVRIWDVRKSALEPVVVDTPVKSFATRRTMILDLYYTKRNLLLSVGKYVTAVPLASSAD